VRQVRERELETDHEQQQHDADLGEQLYLMGVAHEPQNVGAGQHAGEQQPDRGRDTQPMADDRGHHGEPKDDGDIQQDGWHRVPLGGAITSDGT